MNKNSLKIVSVILALAISLSTPFTNYNVYAEVSSGPMYGDVNQDGKINANDALLILYYIANIIVSPELQEKYDHSNFAMADVSGDDVINAYDALHILKYAAGMMDEFDVWQKIQEALTVDVMRENLLKNIESDVTLGNYKSLEVDSEVITVTDEAVQEYIDEIEQYIGVPELTDEIVASLNIEGDITTVEAFEDYIRSVLEEEAEGTRNQLILNDINRQILASSTIHGYSNPELNLEARFEEQITAAKEAAKETPYSYREYIYANTGMSVEEFEKIIYDGLKDYIDLIMLYRAIICAENIEISQEEFDAAYEAYYENYELFEYESVEDYGKEIYEEMLYAKAQRLIMETAVVK